MHNLAEKFVHPSPPSAIYTHQKKTSFFHHFGCSHLISLLILGSWERKKLPKCEQNLFIFLAFHCLGWKEMKRNENNVKKLKLHCRFEKKSFIFMAQGSTFSQSFVCLLLFYFLSFFISFSLSRSFRGCVDCVDLTFSL